MNNGSYIFFRNFANKTRFEIIMCLKDRALSVNEISAKLNHEQSKISHNLAKLASCNILEVKRNGKKRIYSLNKDSVVPLLKIVDHHVKCHCRECGYKYKPASCKSTHANFQ